MIKTFVLLCTIFCLAGAQQSQQGKHLILGDANLIETWRGFAINAPSLLQKNWKTVSSNDDSVQIVAPNCQQTVLSKQDLLNSPEYQSLIANAKQMLYSVESGQMQMSNERRGTIRFSLDGSSQTSSSVSNIGLSTFTNNGVSITKYGQHDMSMSKRPNGFPDNINRIFLTGDVVTFVYNDGRVQMKPAACLQPGEQQLVQQVRAEALESQRRFDLSMQQFQQNMANMGQRMQMNMQNMNHNLNNMFDRFSPNRGQQIQMQPQNNLFHGYRQNNGNYPNDGYNSMGMNGAYAGPMYHGSAAANNYAARQPAIGSGNWPFGSNNSPFWNGFPF